MISQAKFVTDLGELKVGAAENDGSLRAAPLLPRPVFNLASGTSFITSTQDYETSPVFPRRVDIIQSGFEKPKLSSCKNPNWILAEVSGAHGGSRDPYLNIGF